MCVNEIWCSICCRYMDEGCKKCSHFDEQMHLDTEDKVDTKPEHLPYVDKGSGMVTGEDSKDTEKRMTNFDKLLEDPESKELIIENAASQFCFNMDKMIINRHFNCDGCEFQGKDCVSAISEWLHEKYVKGGEE